MDSILKNDIYKHIYFAINHLISSCTIILYFISKINILTQIKIEAFLLVYKWIVEILYNSNSIDLVIHHICAISGLLYIFTNDIEYFKICASKLFVNMHLIHIPMFFYAIKSIFKRLGNKYKKKEEFFYNLYLLTWLFISPYRCLYLLFSGILYYIKGVYSIYLSRIYFFTIPLFFILDYFWTPWAKYKNLLIKFKK